MSEATRNGEQPVGPIDRRMMLGAGLLGAAALAGRASAGPLDPPVGPVASTGRTTDELYAAIKAGGVTLLSEHAGTGTDRLFQINAPGYYLLDQDLVLNSVK